MITVLGVDQSLTNTGFTVLEAMPHVQGTFITELVWSEATGTSKQGEDWILDTLVRSNIIAARMLALIEEHKPQYIVLESPSLGSKGNATRTLPMLLGILLAAIPEGISISTVPPSTLKKFATGKGNATKDMMVDSVATVDPYFHDSLMNTTKSKGRYDMADAYWLAAYKLNELNKD